MSRTSSPFPPKTDFYSKAGAALIVEHIIAYWMKRGYHGITATRYKLADFDLYGVRSNIGPYGYPPRKLGRRAT